MSRLTYARKFTLLGLVLLAPAAFALHAYWQVQGETLAFADLNGSASATSRRRTSWCCASSRRAGRGRAAPGTRRQAALPGARQGRARGRDGGRSRRRRRRAAITELDRRAARATILAGGGGKDYDAAAAAAVGLVVQAGDGSKLILDPDLDSYYVMDTLVTKLPAIADSVGRAATCRRWSPRARSTSGSRRGRPGRAALDVRRAGVGLQTAFKETADGVR